MLVKLKVILQCKGFSGCKEYSEAATKSMMLPFS